MPSIEHMDSASLRIAIVLLLVTSSTQQSVHSLYDHSRDNDALPNHEPLLINEYSEEGESDYKRRNNDYLVANS